MVYANKKDWDKANELMIQNKKLDNFQRKVVNTWKINEENNKIKRYSLEVS